MIPVVSLRFVSHGVVSALCLVKHDGSGYNQSPQFQCQVPQNLTEQSG